MKKSQEVFQGKRFMFALSLCIALIGTQSTFAQKSKSKVSSSLLEVHQNKESIVRSAAKANGKVASSVSGLDYLVIRDNYVKVSILVSGNGKSVIRDLKKKGMKDATIFGGTVVGFLPIEAISSLEGVKNVKFARPVYKGKTKQGKVTTQGHKAQRSDKVRNSLNVTGKGVKIGVISDSYNLLKGESSGIKSGDLPGEGNPKGKEDSVTVLKEYTGSDFTDEGRGMIEIIHDIASDAELTFHTAFEGSDQMVKAMRALAKDGADIIVDDLGYANEPFFQDGPIVREMGKLVKDYGVVFFTAAGNSNNESYQSKFRPISNDREAFEESTGNLIGKYTFHDFNSGSEQDIFQKIELGPKSTLVIPIQWDEPHASVCENCPGSRNDIDIFLLKKPDLKEVVAFSADDNVGNDPYELLVYENTTTKTKTLHLAIGQFRDPKLEKKQPSPNIIKYLNFSGDIEYKEYPLNSPTVYGHTNTNRGLSIAAANFNKTPEFKVDPPKVASYSSLGGLKIYFSAKGERLETPQRRNKPDFVAPDAGNTTFFGYDTDIDEDKLPNFFGTSAAAPHAAAVAALLLEMRGNKKSASIGSLLASTAIDMDNPATKKFDKGYDFRTGTGLINSVAAASKLKKEIGVGKIKLTPVCTNDPAKKRKWKVENPNNFTVRGTWSISGGSQKDKLVAKKGKTFITANTEGSNTLVIKYKDGDKKEVKVSSKAKWLKCGKKSIEDITELNENVAFSLENPYPNPVANELNLNFHLGTQQVVVLKIYDINGKIQHIQTIDAESGANHLVHNVEALNSGIYHLRFETNTGAELGSSKILKK